MKVPNSARLKRLVYYECGAISAILFDKNGEYPSAKKGWASNVMGQHYCPKCSPAKMAAQAARK